MYSNVKKKLFECVYCLKPTYKAASKCQQLNVKQGKVEQSGAQWSTVKQAALIST